MHRSSLITNNVTTSKQSTVECRYNVKQYIMILYTAMQWQQQNMDQTSHSQKTPHTSPLRARQGMSFVRILEKIYRVYKIQVHYITLFVFVQYSKK